MRGAQMRLVGLKVCKSSMYNQLYYISLRIIFKLYNTIHANFRKIPFRIPICLRAKFNENNHNNPNNSTTQRGTNIDAILCIFTWWNPSIKILFKKIERSCSLSWQRLKLQGVNHVSRHNSPNNLCLLVNRCIDACSDQQQPIFCRNYHNTVQAWHLVM